MKNFTKNLGIYVILIVLSILVAQFFMQQTPDQIEDFSYSDLIKAVQAGEIDEVTMIGNSEVTGIYNGSEFEVAVPPEDNPALMSFFRDNDVRINTEPEPTAAWWTSVLIYILPIAIIIVFWLFIMQRMQGGGNQMMSFGKSRARLNESEKKVSFDDV
ncbi:MAG: ATP-dependent metallopeptidase FtsH/Yme1/Tma family protein, partial [Halanaerobiales bacterium]